MSKPTEYDNILLRDIARHFGARVSDFRLLCAARSLVIAREFQPGTPQRVLKSKIARAWGVRESALLTKRFRRMYRLVEEDVLVIMSETLCGAGIDFPLYID